MGPETLKEQLQSLRIERPSFPAAPPGGGRRRRLVLGAAAAVLLTAGIAAHRFLLGAPLEVRVVVARLIGENEPAAGVLLSGAGYLITAEKYIAVGVRVPGRVERYFVDEGDRVQAGQLLVKLDDRDYRAQQGRAEAALRVADANAGLAASRLERLRRLFAEKVVSSEELEEAQSRAAVATATVSQAQNELAQARVNREDTELRSPVQGVVLAKLKTVGEIAVPGGFSGAGDLLRLADLSEIRAEVDVSEADLAQVKIGQDAEVTPDAFPDHRYAARVVKLYPQVNRQKGTLKVEVRIETPDERLIPDMSVRISFLAAASSAGDGKPGKATVAVRRAAVRGTGTDRFVWFEREGRAKRQPIRAGAEIGEDVLVLEGLAGGESVIIGDEGSLREGAAVTVRDR